jgi:hypothetical protein
MIKDGAAVERVERMITDMEAVNKIAAACALIFSVSPGFS